MGQFDILAPDPITVTSATDSNIKKYTESLNSYSSGDAVDTSITEKPLTGHAMLTEIFNNETSTPHYCADFFEPLQRVSQGNFRDMNPKLKMKLLLKSLALRDLKLEITRVVQ